MEQGYLKLQQQGGVFDPATPHVHKFPSKKIFYIIFFISLSPWQKWQHLYIGVQITKKDRGFIRKKGLLS
mgnify:CR=1 FL=1